MTLVGDGKFWTVKETQERLAAAGLPASDTTVRSMVEKRYLRAWWTIGGHTRIEPASVEELIPFLELPPAERRAQLEGLARHNGAKDPEAEQE